VIPTQHRTIVKIGRQELIDAVDRIAVMIRNASTFMVKMTIKDNYMSIASGELEIGKAEEKIYVEQEGEDLIIKMDYRFLFEGLKSLIGEVVEIQFNGPESAILFQSAEMPGFIYIMMPLII
jgi:DNA polymerase-3 subunit beta